MSTSSSLSPYPLIVPLVLLLVVTMAAKSRPQRHTGGGLGKTDINAAPLLAVLGPAEI